MVLRTLLFVLLLACAPALRAQGPLLYEQFGQDQGLPLPNIHAVVQDSAGFLWIATEGGLLRYDGRTFRPYRSLPDDPNSLATAFVHALHPSPEGLWVGTYGGGLDRYDPRTERFTHLRGTGPDAQTFSIIRALAPARGGGVWAGTGSGHVFRQGAAGPRRDVLAPERDGDEVSAILDDATGLWIGRNSGLYRVVRGRQVLTSIRDLVYAIHKTRTGRLLVGTSRGVFDLTGPAPRRLTAAPDGPLDPDTPVHALAEASDGTLWLGTAPGPSTMAARDSVFHLDVNAAADDASTVSLLQAHIQTLFVDQRGTLWVGTELHGLFKRNRPRVDFLGDKLLENPDVTALLESPTGILWIGTYGGLVRYDLVKKKGRAVGGDVFGSSLRGLAAAPDGSILVGTRSNGLFRVHPKTFAVTPFAPPDSTPRPLSILSIHTDPRGQPWVATADAGVCTMGRGWRRLVCIQEGLPTPAYATYWDSMGRLWMSFWGSGIVRYDPKTRAVRRYQHLDNTPGTLPANNVTTFREMEGGSLWVATYGSGIARFDEATGSFEVFDERHGLPSAIVFGIVPVGPALWLSTSRGVAQFTPSDQSVRVFDRRDGLQGDEFNANAALRLSNGQMAFGGTAGLNFIDPTRIDPPLPPPPVRLTALRVRDRPYAQPLAALDRLRLPMRENFVAFEFAALDFSAPPRNRYSYRLEGLGEDWSTPSNLPVASYTDLRPGSYTFRVRAAGSDGVWRDDALVLPVEIVPPFWRTRWFQGLLLVGLFGAVAYGVRSVSTRRLREEMARLDAERRVQAERVRISRDLHDHVGAQLANVISVADLLRHHAKTGDGEEIDRFATALDHDARETMQQLRRTIWATSSDQVSILAVFEQLDQYARHLLRFRKEPRLVVRLYETDDALPASERFLRPVHGLHLLRIAQEAIANTLKHAHATRLDVDVHVRAEELELTVRDNGTFKPPATDGPSMGELGARGFGLGGMRARADEIGATLEAGPHPEGGTCVTVRLRLDPAPLPAVRPSDASLEARSL